MNKHIKKFISIADFLGDVLGSNTEIILHDLTNYEESIVHIINGHISDRKIGDPVTDLVLEFIASESKGNKQFISNYNSKTIEGRLLYSSTYFIRDDNNEIVGALCLNSDYHEVKKSLSFLTSLLPNYVDDKILSINNIKENLNTDPQELTLSKIDAIINEFDVVPNRMTTDEKTNVITALNDCGVFNIRGSVQEVAKKLQMSEPSIYRYIKKIKS
ncbi:helix-turn-helix transcriptional regulator [Poseidonibacter lekithochrous]|uniref:helix-turn-helix transcriptional regulator n=1 Tax=Poseidonibacter lekithochrous TaxID=1904463 RepID=UPI0009FAE01D|nr:PAS domain-containing protein [Poseidonibacter lekithochrous]QKJ22643.1 PAS domain-containing transcriptional regulator, YheO family [Poseidonibacter lekithochrous]